MSGLTNAQKLGWAQLIGTQASRRGNAIALYQRDPLPLPPGIRQLLRRPLNPDTPPSQAPPNVNNYPINVISQTLVIGTGDQYIAAQPNRVVVMVQNQSSANLISVNFDQAAPITGASPNFQSQGIMLQPGVSLWWDKWCPTGTIHISATAASTPVAVIQGYSPAGNLPEVSQLTNILQALLAMVQPPTG